MSCDAGEATDGLENESSFFNLSVTSTTSQLILQPFLPSLYLHHSSFSNPSIASPTTQIIPQPFFRFSYITSSSLNSPGEPPMIPSVLTSSFGIKYSTFAQKHVYIGIHTFDNIEMTLKYHKK